MAMSNNQMDPDGNLNGNSNYFHTSSEGTSIGSDGTRIFIHDWTNRLRPRIGGLHYQRMWLCYSEMVLGAKICQNPKK